MARRSATQAGSGDSSADGSNDPGHRLQLAHSFGILNARAAAPRDAVLPLWDDSFIFLAGRNVGVCDHARNKVAFLERDARGRTITALARSSNCKLLALAERLGGEEGSVRISILGLPKAERLMGAERVPGAEKPEVVKVLQPANRRLDIVGLAFTCDSKYLISLSAAPSSAVTFWQWHNDKANAAVASQNIESPVTRIQVHPRHVNSFSVSGPRLFRMWSFKPAESQLEESPSLLKGNQEKQTSVADHCWAMGNVLCAATEACEVFVFVEGELKQTVDVRSVIAKHDAETGRPASEKHQAKLAPSSLGISPQKSRTRLKLTAVAAWQSGFVVGGNCGYLGVFKVGSADFSVEPVGTFRLPSEEASIWAMAPGSLSEDTQNLAILSYTESEAEESTAATVSLTRSRTASSMARGRGSSSRAADERKQSKGADSGVSQEPVMERKWSLTTFPVGSADMVATGQLEAFAPVQAFGAYGQHTGSITGMGISSLRNLLVTCGADMHLKAWSYPSEDLQAQANAFNAEISMRLGEKPLALAVHPLGFQVAVALEDVVQIHHLTTQEVTRTLLEVSLKYPGPLAYSNSGALLAVTSDMDVVLLDPLRSVVVHVFSGRGGHLSPVNQVTFSQDDRTLLSCSAAPHGAIYGWELETAGKERRFEHVSKGTCFSRLAYDFRKELVVALTRPEGFLRVVGHMSNDPLDIKPDGSAARFTSLCLAAHLGVLFVGNQSGSVVLFNWPPADGDASPRPVAEVALHSESVTALTISDNAQVLFSACESGTLMASEVVAPVREETSVAPTPGQMDQRAMGFRYRTDSAGRDRDHERRKEDMQMKLDQRGVASNTAAMNEMVMVPKSYLKELLGDVNELEERFSRLEHETEHFLEQKDNEFREKLQTAYQEKEYEVQMAESKMERMGSQMKQDKEASRVTLEQETQQFEKCLRDLQSEFESKLSKEYDKESALLNTLDAMKAQRDKDMTKAQNEHAQTLQAAQLKSEKQLNGMQAEYNGISNILISDSLRFEEVLKQQESEHHTQLEEADEQHKTILSAQAERLDVASKESIRAKQGLRILEGRVKELEVEKSTLARERDELDKKLQERNEMLSKVRDQLRERERGLKLKDESLANLREQTKHLESFRFVLFHKVKALEEERDPLEEQVNNLKSNVREMYTEFVREFKGKQELRVELGERENLSGALQREVGELRHDLTTLRKANVQLFKDLEMVLHASTQAEYERMPHRLADVLDKYKKVRQWLPKSGEKLDLEVDEDPERDALVADLTMQRDLLFRKNQLAMQTADQVKKDCNQDMRRMIAQNTDLLAECNSLRGEGKHWKRQSAILDSKITGLNAKNRRVEAELSALEASFPRSPSRSDSAPGGIGNVHAAPARTPQQRKVASTPQPKRHRGALEDSPAASKGLLPRMGSSASRPSAPVSRVAQSPPSPAAIRQAAQTDAAESRLRPGTSGGSASGPL